jgi:ubiquinone biosynthesis protein
VGRLDRFERAGLIDMMRGLQTEDPALVRETALRIGTHTKRIDQEALNRARSPGCSPDPSERMPR